MQRWRIYCPFVHAADVERDGLVKRVGAAIREGAGVVAQLHSYLTRTPKDAAVHASSAAEPPSGSPPRLHKQALAP